VAERCRTMPAVLGGLILLGYAARDRWRERRERERDRPTCADVDMRRDAPAVRAAAGVPGTRPRLVLFFPVYGVLARWGARPALHRAILAVSLAGFTLCAALYAGRYFVA